MMLGPRQSKLVERLETYMGEQGFRYLECDGKQCVMGVAVRLAMEDGVEVRVRLAPNGITYFDNHPSILPESVRDYFDFVDSLGFAKVGRDSLVALNDSKRLTFKEIAAELRSGEYFKEVK